MPKAATTVVIPPMTGLDDGKFTCIGKGLLYDGHGREAPESLRVLLMPGAHGEAITDRSRPKSWWTAQALLYDLPCSKSANISTIRAQLEAAIKAKTLEVPARLRQLENKSNREFNKLNKEVLEKTGGGTTGKSTAAIKATGTTSAKPAPAKVAAVPKPPKATAPKPPAATKPAAPKPAPAAKATATAVPKKEKGAKLGEKKPVRPKAETTQTPTKPKAKQTAKRTANAAFKEEDDVMDWSPLPNKRSKMEPKEEAMRPASTGFVKEEYAYDHDDGDDDDNDDGHDDGYGYAGSSSMAGPSGSYSGPPPTDCVAGSWEIACRYIADGWDQFSYGQFSLNVVRTHARQHIEANFDLGLVNGVIQSKSLEGRTDGGAYVTFEWVGREDDGPVLPPNNRQSGYIRFTKEAGGAMPTLKGAIQGLPACGPGNVEFTGVWRGPPGRNDHRWDDFDEQAYEEARVNRWG